MIIEDKKELHEAYQKEKSSLSQSLDSKPPLDFFLQASYDRKNSLKIPS
jgi:hypothetical protein